MRRSLALVVVLALHTVASGRDLPANECLIGVVNAGGETLAGPIFHCRDGDPCDADRRANGRCRLDLRGCVDIPGVPGCAPRPIRQAVFKIQKHARPGLSEVGFPNLDSTTAAFVCTRRVRLNMDATPAGTRPDRRRVLAKATANVHKLSRNRDQDKFRIVCDACPLTASDGRCLRCPESCDNPDGGPDRLDLGVGGAGADVDVGWSGPWHSFGAIPTATIGFCASGCDGTRDTSCDLCHATSAGGAFGPPVPLLATNVPVCVVNRWRDKPRGWATSPLGRCRLGSPSKPTST